MHKRPIREEIAKGPEVANFGRGGALVYDEAMGPGWDVEG